MKPTDLSLHVTNYLTRYLAGQRNLSPNTIKAYRDVFTLLLRFGRDGRGIAVERLCLADIDVTFVEAFLDHLSQDRFMLGARLVAGKARIRRQGRMADTSGEAVELAAIKDADDEMAISRPIGAEGCR